MKSRGNQTCARWLQSNRSQTESSCYGLEGHDFDFVGDGDGDGDGVGDGEFSNLTLSRMDNYQV